MSTIKLMQPRMDGGEGSRGGKVVGHTSDGKPIYQSHSHSGHKDFGAMDHFEAADRHGAKANVSREKRKKAIIGGRQKDAVKQQENLQHHQEQEHKHLQSWVKAGGLKVTHPE